MDWKSYDLDRAAYRVAISNSPMFLFDGLFEDSEVRRIATECSSEEILSEFLLITDSGLMSAENRLKSFVLIAAAAASSDRKLIGDLDRVAQNYGGWISLITSAARERTQRPLFHVHSYDAPPTVFTSTPGTKPTRSSNRIKVMSVNEG